MTPSAAADSSQPIAAAPHRIRCASIWGGNEPVDQDVVTAGISASIYSSASGGSRGGDVYYFSNCAVDRLTRIAVADVRGHGESVGKLGEWVYSEMEQRMNALDGAGIFTNLNERIHERGFEALTTAVVVSFYRGDSNLYLSYAGHPPVFLRRREDEWTMQTIEGDPGPANLPLGALRSTRYDQAVIPVRPGDRLLLYTDGVLECAGGTGDFFGEQRLIDTLKAADGLTVGGMRRAVLDALRQHAGGEILDDDCTVIAIEINTQGATGDLFTH